MIASLRGTISELCPLSDNAVEVVVDVGGVGYRVLVTVRFAATIGPVGSHVHLAVHTHVREGDITLYGFADVAERRVFEALLGAHGVGPALALAILGALSPALLTAAVTSGDLDTLTLVPGVGRKTAQRLLLDLAQRLVGLESGFGIGVAAAVAAEPARAEVREALVALGYGTEEIRDALELLGEDESVEELVRGALRVLAPRR